MCEGTSVLHSISSFVLLPPPFTHKYPPSPLPPPPTPYVNPSLSPSTQYIYLQYPPPPPTSMLPPPAPTLPAHSWARFLINYRTMMMITPAAPSVSTRHSRLDKTRVLVKRMVQALPILKSGVVWGRGGAPHWPGVNRCHLDCLTFISPQRKGNPLVTSRAAKRTGGFGRGFVVFFVLSTTRRLRHRDWDTMYLMFKCWT